MQFFSPVSRVFTNIRQAVSEFVVESPDEEEKCLSNSVNKESKVKDPVVEISQFPESPGKNRDLVDDSPLFNDEEADNLSCSPSCTSEPMRVAPEYQEIDSLFDEIKIIMPDRETPTLIEEEEAENEFAEGGNSSDGNINGDSNAARE